MRKNKNTIRLLSLVFPAVLICLLEAFGQFPNQIIQLLISLGVSSGSIPDFTFIVPPSLVMKNTIAAIPDMGEYIASTTWRTVSSFFLSAIFGGVLGLLLGVKSKAETMLLPSVNGFRSIPPVALLPIFILFLGTDDMMKIAFITFGAIWPIAINTYFGVKSIDDQYIKVAKNIGLREGKIVKKIIFPLSLPGIFAGLKISISLCLILSIVVEMLAGNDGLGWFLNYSKRNFDFDLMYGTIVIIAVLGIGLNIVMKLLERKILHWYYDSRSTRV